uniref:NADH dehydrogenase subunit 6 n=1 Tax=Trioza remota TaxID=1715813 RepID=A0A344A2V8_9HEMI|nr:NADH dehydrogenase subunit 6 [Trioza remota]AWU49099.1 NADH dehydrogenase subunit 6 [Trioza remota]
MLQTLMIIMVILSAMMPLMSTPLSMGMLILIQTIMICSITRTISLSSWLPFTMFLVMASGLMVIFTYVTSICSNNKFSFMSMKLLFFAPLIFLWLQKMPHLKVMFNDNLQNKDLFNHEFIKLYTKLNIFSSFFMFIYLLIILIIMINLLCLNKGPMRKKY